MKVHFLFLCTLHIHRGWKEGSSISKEDAYISLLNVYCSLGNNQLSNVGDARSNNYQNEIHNLYDTSKQLTSQIISLTLVLSNLSSFLSDQLLPVFHTAATVHSMPGAAHLTSTNSAQCKTFFSPYSFIDCRSMADCLGFSKFKQILLLHHTEECLESPPV